ncbi:hypothetical protein NMY22_g18222 [Coprinellus aureogranulatus]|nr:hypothetical protein NMY22_g18222 [Coprinellus aureogranulatus]
MTQLANPEPSEKEPLLDEEGTTLAGEEEPQARLEEDAASEDDGDDEKERVEHRRTASRRAGDHDGFRKRQFIFLGFFIFAVWLAYAVRVHLSKKQKPQVIYASRYSKEHKYRPAASPIITETLKDGRIRLRGATPPPATPTPTPTTKKRRTRKRKSGSKKVGKRTTAGRK